MSNPHPDRPIAVPKRRLNRTASSNSVGSTGSQGASSPLSGFSFGAASAPISAAKPPLQPSNFSTGFGSPSITGFGNTNPNSSIGFGGAMNTPPTTSATTPALTGFGGFGNQQVSTSPSTSFTGFGNANVSSPLSGFGNNNTPVSSANTNTGFSNSPFSGFQMNAQPQQAKIVEIDDEADMDSEESEKNTTTTTTTTTAAFSGFGAPKEAVSTPPTFSFGTPSTNTNTTNEPKKPAFSGFAFGTPAVKPAETEKPSTPSFGGFGAPAKSSETEKSDKEPIANKPTPTFSFGTPKSTVDTSSKTSDAPSPFGGFGKPSTTSTPSTFTGFGTPVVKAAEDKPTEPKKTTDTPSPFSSFGTPAKSAVFSFTPPTTKPADTSDNNESEETEQSIEKPSPFSIVSPTEKPSPFGSKSVDQPSTSESTTSSDKPSPFGSIKPADKSSEESDKDESDDLSKDNSKDDSEGTTTNATEKPSPFASSGSVKPPISASGLSASAKPFTPSTSFGNKESTSSPFGSFGKPTSKETTSDTENVDTGKRSSISSIGSSKSSTSSAPSPFSFTKPTASNDKPTTISSFGSFGKSTSSSESAAPTFTFSAPTKASTDKPAAPTFSFGTTPASTDKPTTPQTFSFGKANETPASKPFSFNAPTSNKSSPFSFNAPSSETSQPSHKKRQLDRDDDEDGPSASKKTFTIPKKATPPPFGSDKPATFSFGSSTSANKNTTSQPPVFTFGAPASANTEKEDPSSTAKAPVFSFGTPAKDSGNKESAPSTSKAPTFSFGTPAKATADIGSTSSSTNVPTFTFGAPAKTTTTEKEGADKAFSFTAPSTTTAPEKKNFSFGAAPSLEKTIEAAKDKAAPAAKSTISFGTTPTSTETSKDTTDAEKDSTSSKSNEKPSTLGKSPLSKSVTHSDPSPFSLTKDTDKDKDANKKASFGLSNPSTSDAPGSVSLAFSKVGNAETNTSATLNLASIKKDTISSDRSSTPTTLKSDISDISQISYQTRFWELPDDARNELALLAHYITEQTDKKDKISEELSSSFGPTLREMNVTATNMDTDATILRQQLQVQGELLEELIARNREQRLNAVSASNVQKQDTKNWRVKGAAENWTFYTKTIESMENRLRQFKFATESIEESIIGLERDFHLTPESIGAAVENQRRNYLVLAGRVAELHQEAGRVIKRRRLN